MINYTKLFGIIALFAVLLVACAVNSNPPTESALPPKTLTSTPKPLPSNTPSATLQPTATATPTVRWEAQVIEIIPAIEHVELEQVHLVNFASFTDDTQAVYSFITGGSDSAEQSLNWGGYDLSTRSEISATAPIHYDESLWKRNHIQKIAFHPELDGHFSPSGKYVIYSVWYGSVFDQDSKTEIWIAETAGQRKFKIFEFGYSNVYIQRAAWVKDESQVIFNASYEGPSEFYLADLPSRKTVPLSAVINDFDGITEEPWALSPDGETLAVIDWGRRLIIVSLETGKLKVVEAFGGTWPTWSADGKRLYYWWGPNKDTWYQVNELRVYDLSTEAISTVVDKSSLVRGFHDYEGDNINLASEYYLGEGYAISDNESQLLLWNPGLYWVTLHE